MTERTAYRLSEKRDIISRVLGPHEWGYRDVTDGAFIEDHAPFEAGAEIERLRSVGDAAFYAMCAYRDNADLEVFQDAIDALGVALHTNDEGKP